MKSGSAQCDLDCEEDAAEERRRGGEEGQKEKSSCKI